MAGKRRCIEGLMRRRTTARGRVYYGILIGVTLFAIRTASTYPDGIAFAVLLGNAAAPLIDRAVAQRTAHSR